MKLLKLSQGKFAQVDDEDYDYLNQWKWHAAKWGNSFYAKRSERFASKQNQKSIYLHRVILGIKEKSIFIDHIDHDGLNNQRSNLRTCSHSENQKNSQGRGSSKFLGVAYRSSNNKFRAAIYTGEKDLYIGQFESEEEAARAYDEQAKIYHGEFANLNFK